ncbi:hypothetical protein SAMN05421736_12311 [Evansella caseinilytica]|uniref:Cbb3-type cytochrome oxidase component FixQ n=1 Tax=Evansella caseinilytica TaxID=1503961 RepID=A0A1H3ULL8_9BACI|nr:hypothetical protein [Evansella caseinilytica]SDZ63247.1 hypothetical protein SAMN05421736_12311 [Evansella caseinilytica]
MINDFMIMILPVFVVFVSLGVFFLWVIKSKEPYEMNAEEGKEK